MVAVTWASAGPGLALVLAALALDILHLLGRADKIWALATWLAASVAYVVIWLLHGGDEPWLALATMATTLNAWHLWRHWRKRRKRRAAELPGAKSAALRDALVRRVRQAALPRPVLPPVPGAA